MQWKEPSLLYYDSILRYAGYQIFCLFVFCIFPFLFWLLSSLLSSPRLCLLGWMWLPIVSQFMAPVTRATRLSLEPLSPNLQLPGKGPIAQIVVGAWSDSHYNHVDWCRRRQFLVKEDADPSNNMCSPSGNNPEEAENCLYLWNPTCLFYHQVYKNFLCSLVAFYSLPHSKPKWL